ncbi:DUF523 domain-containing protein [Macrococcus equipercicus]|uniref:DUF523 domain-containing protein n=1 Tax=Macrococcus equipercicus TaxID=69967 RepID=A0ABQ6RB32_9STAP|nr:DUF523 domain-containing protein [Macrococcus equipercicus]KAA1042396.1 DUF523 domain-containing protein [Macrococcus equipercicus]
MILVSSCLIGEEVRYDGRHQLNSSLKTLVDDGKAIAACPELMGGLLVPRTPAEIIGGAGEDVWQGTAQVMTRDGRDVTADYKAGAERFLEICLQHHITTVILKENSPSCGSQAIYDGTFSGEKIAGEGVTTALLLANGIKVYSEKNFINK